MAKTNCENLDQQFLDGKSASALMDAVASCLGEELRRFAESRCGSRGDAEDISQDALLAAHRYLAGFRGEAALKTWLYRLVVSACSRRRRGHKNDPRLHRPIDDAGPIPAERVNPEVELMLGERLAALETAMAELRPDDRELLSETEWQGLSLKQVAERHRLTVPAVKSRMFRIRKQLKELVNARFGAAAPAVDAGTATDA
jgi:RNA polymerase sigma-70 factor (ECF subfamily)